MTQGLFRVALADGTRRLARGDTETGPSELLPAELTLNGLLGAGARRGALGEALESAPAAGPVDGARVLAPIEDQEVWAAGVTYERSRDARMEEAVAAPSVYDLVYDAARPELFFKAAGWRVRAPGAAIGVRADSAWNVPEPELALVVAADLSIAGYVIGNDVSSRTIEGENPLYLPQAKVYDGSCALGPCIVPASLVQPPFGIRLEIRRAGELVMDGTTSTGRLRRSFEDLAGYLGRALSLPAGAVLLTGTGIVPDSAFTLSDGDVVRIAIAGLGALENPVVQVGGTETRPA